MFTGSEYPSIHACACVSETNPVNGQSIVGPKPGGWWCHTKPEIGSDLVKEKTNKIVKDLPRVKCKNRVGNNSPWIAFLLEDKAFVISHIWQVGVTQSTGRHVSIVKQH